MSRPMPAVTSLIPGLAGQRAEVQRRAVASWRALGLEVISLNAAEEAPAVAAAFPDIEVRPLAESGRALVGRPVPFVHDLLALIAGRPCDLGVILNADIVLAPKARLPARWPALAHGPDGRPALLAGQRSDVADLAGLDSPPDPPLFSPGYDYFVLSPALAGELARPAAFCLGQPFWDHALPLFALLAGHPVRALRLEGARHVAHPRGWEDHKFLFFGHLLNEVLGRCRARTAGAAQPGGALDLPLAALTRLHADLLAAADQEDGSRALAVVYDSLQASLLGHLHRHLDTIRDAP